MRALPRVRVPCWPSWVLSTYLIVHYSVEWWNTLHQGPSVTKFGKPSMDASMLVPLLVMTLGFMFFFGHVLMRRVQNELLARGETSRGSNC